MNMTRFAILMVALAIVFDIYANVRLSDRVREHARNEGRLEVLKAIDERRYITRENTFDVYSAVIRIKIDKDPLNKGRKK